jgi:hypothetical protein
VNSIQNFQDINYTKPSQLVARAPLVAHCISPSGARKRMKKKIKI